MPEPDPQLLAPSRPWPSAPLEDLDALFIVENGEPHGAARLIALAEAMTGAVPSAADSGGTVGVCSSSAAFVTAACLALWTLDRQPLMLDPSLRQEPKAVFDQAPEMATLVDAPHPTFRNTILIEQDAASTPRGAWRPRWPEPHQTAALFLTSGSTGEPKLVRKRGYQLFRQMQQEIEWLGSKPGLSIYSLVPPFHVLGFAHGLFLPLLAQGRTAFSPGALPVEWLRTIANDKPNLVLGVPYHYRALAQHARGLLPKATYYSSGAPLSPAVDQAFRRQTGQNIVQGYGSSETGGIGKRTGFGGWQPASGLEWSIRADDGRLMVRSPWQDEPSAWHVTDDVAEAEGDGFVLLGRADSIVKVAGKRFSTNEIVTAAQGLPDIAEAAAVTFERFGEAAVALFAVPAEEREPEPAELRAALTERLAGFKLPRTIRIVNELPRLGTGKVDQQRLRKLAIRSASDHGDD